MNLQPNQTRCTKTTKIVYGIELFVAASRSIDGELVIIATTYQAENALNRYKLRWGLKPYLAF